MAELRRVDHSKFVLRPSGLWADAPELLERLAKRGLRRVTINEALDSADRQARPLEPGEPPLAALPFELRFGFAWNEDDRSGERWYPQGIATSQESGGDGLWEGREVLVASWALDTHRGTRVSFAELGSGPPASYQHALLAEPVSVREREGADLAPVRVHAGGIAWNGPHLYVADTLRGLRVFDLRELLEVSVERDDVLGHADGAYYAYGYRYVLPQVGTYQLSILRALLSRGPKFSFISLSRPPSVGAAAMPSVLSGEYWRERDSRLIRWPLPASDSPEHLYRPIAASEALVSQRTHLQAVLELDGHYLLASSAGRRPGTLIGHRADDLVAAFEQPWAVGPEDLCHAPGRDLLLSLTEHPHDPETCARCGRVVFGVGAAELLSRTTR